MIEQQNNMLWFKFNGFLRYILCHLATNIMPLYVVNEYPKSGGSWVAGMLSDALGVPFPRNRLPMMCSSILHGHMMHSWNMHNVLIVWRDGRDVLISQYFHSLFENDRGNKLLVAQTRSDLNFSNYEDVESNLVSFMKYVYEEKRHPRMSWVDFVNKWDRFERGTHVRYEDLRIRPVDELQRIANQFECALDRGRLTEIVEKYSFEKMSGRKVGESNKRSFLRKGVVGDWKNYFNRDAREYFCAYAGDALIKLGYEPDTTWVHDYM